MRVLFVQPSLQPPGGGNGVAAWMIQGLRQHHELTVLTWAPVDLREVNQHFGTDLRAGDASFVQAHPGLAEVLSWLPTPNDLMKTALLMRTGRERARQFDVAISGNNEADLGDRAIQYIHYPRYQRPRPGADVRWFHTPAVLRSYYALADAASGISFARMRSNRTLVNSAWTARLIRRLHGIEPSVLHPPVAASPVRIAWESRRNAFLCLGRIAPEKEIEKVIEIVGKVRHRGHDVSLTIAGGAGPAAYMQRIRTLAGESSTWARVETGPGRNALNELISSHRYGIHGMSEEHFGMAPAEMLASGCLVFAPSGGGLPEILDSDPRFLYDSPDDAVAKIDTVLRSPDLQSAARRAYEGKRACLSAEAFMQTFRSVVSEFEP